MDFRKEDVFKALEAIVKARTLVTLRDHCFVTETGKTEAFFSEFWKKKHGWEALVATPRFNSRKHKPWKECVTDDFRVLRGTKVRLRDNSCVTVNSP